MFKYALEAGKALCLQVLFSPPEDIALVDMVAEHSVLNTRSATLPYFELDTQAVSSTASIEGAPSSAVIRMFMYSRHSVMSTTIISRRREDNALANMVAGRGVYNTRSATS